MGIRLMVDWLEIFNKMSDEELEDWVSKNAALGSKASNLAIAELTRRSVNETRNSIIELNSIIKEFSSSSERYSKRIVCLTWALVILTVVLLILTVVMVFSPK
jgi:hypothetical protein